MHDNFGFILSGFSSKFKNLMFAQGNREFAPGTYFGHWPRWEYWKQGNALQILLSNHTWELALL